MQQRVGRSEPGLADQTREKGQHCRPLRAAGGRCQRDDAEDKGERAVAGGDGGQRQHEHETHEVPHHEDRPLGISIRDRTADRSEQHVREQAADRRGGDPGGRVGRVKDVSEKRRVVEPVADLRSGARADQHTRIPDREHPAVGSGSLHREATYHS